MRVLVVEDNESERLLTVNIIKRNPACKVEWVSNVEDARAKISCSDLIVLDLKMPNKAGDTELNSYGGLEILKFIKEMPPEDRPQVVIMSKTGQNSFKAQQIKHDHLYELISKWFHKLEDCQNLSEYLSTITFKQKEVAACQIPSS